MVVAEIVEKTMKKPTVKVSVSDSDSSSSDSTDELKNEEHDNEQILEADGESSDGSNTDSAESSSLVTNKGWADSVAKILGSSKPKHKKSLVLSRAKKYVETIKKEKDVKPEFEVIGESIDIKKEEEHKEEKCDGEPPTKRIKHEKPTIRVKPNILEKDRERLLAKIATKGVVQLFNAVRNQQRTLEKDINKSNLTEGKKEKILKKFDKRTFLDKLMGQTKSIIVDKEANTVKDEVKVEDSVPKWNALRDDFMMGAKMKDWDKESVDE
ncbi:unnamed protein product [Diatraea saccharalis]|uniref:RRP15-like protein n=1 Tax=Diatraea saccharalis TaxID=40085 RepID=A0A9N9R4H3_9NEOP|nr:unnamed protein product [Diatraea saccharalis]